MFSQILFIKIYLKIDFVLDYQ